MPNPNIPDSERWSTGLGKDYFPFVRKLGGVSLFDFQNFDPDEYSQNFPSSSWTEFVPYRMIWGSAVWIEIDRDQVRDNLIDPESIMKKWHQDSVRRPRVMPYIEAGYFGKISVRYFRRILLVNEDGAKEDFTPQ